MIYHLIDTTFYRIYVSSTGFETEGGGRRTFGTRCVIFVYVYIPCVSRELGEAVRSASRLAISPDDLDPDACLFFFAAGSSWN